MSATKHAAIDGWLTMISTDHSTQNRKNALTNGLGVSDKAEIADFAANAGSAGNTHLEKTFLEME
ncbi:hypothetical protein [Pararhizobium arenae]|uniref:hypothetical protein n=1 Tax=Pararhizobium arenae TaxID=1856850 RepID=UPI00117A8A1D|nr:hypothetical protein [Pararhizobium arenae]